VKRNDTGEVIVPDGTDMTKVGTGQYSYQFTEPSDGLTYTAYVEIVYGGNTYWFEEDITGTTTGIVSSEEVQQEMGISSATAMELAIIQTAIKRAERAVKRYLRYDPVKRQRTEFYPRGPVTASGWVRWEASETEAYLRRYGTGRADELILQHIPVRNIDYLYVDYDGRFGQQSGAFSDNTLKAEGTDYWLSFDMLDDSGKGICFDGILRCAGTWPAEPGTVKVVYTAGYSSDELRGNLSIIDASPIWESVLEEAVRRAKKALTQAKASGIGHFPGILVSESLGDYHYSVDVATARSLFGGVWDVSGATRERLSPFIHWGMML